MPDIPINGLSDRALLFPIVNLPDIILLLTFRKFLQPVNLGLNKISR